MRIQVRHHGLTGFLLKIMVFSLIAGVLSGGGLPVAAQEDDQTGGAVGDPPRIPITARFGLPISADVVYTVQPRETLDQIAAAFDVQLACLRETNELRPADILAINQELVISVACPAYDGVLTVTYPRADAPGRTGEDGTYVVRPNDTLDTIAQALDISVDALQIANDIPDGRTLGIGAVLTIPEDAPVYGVFPALTDETLEDRLAAAGDDAETYVVQPNDTLDTIAQELNVSTVDLLQSNGLVNGRGLRIGFTLVIPADAAPYGEFPALTDEVNAETRARTERGELTGEEYIIQPNDTLDTIAQAFNVSVVAIRQANEIDSIAEVVPGRLLIIPADAPVYGTYPAVGEAAGDQVADGAVYIIQPGDTLDHIAAQFNVDTLCLLERNGVLQPRLIQPGEAVGIPSDCPPYTGFDVVATTAPATLDN